MNNVTVSSPLSYTVPLEFRWMPPPPPRKVSQKERRKKARKMSRLGLTPGMMKVEVA